MKVIEALKQFKDFLYCASGDFYFLHHMVEGTQFDSYHKVYEKYYEESKADYDNLVEWLVGFGHGEDNANGAADRISYPSFNATSVDVVKAIDRSNEILRELTTGFYITYTAADKAENALLCGLAAELQSRLAYWAKEYCYFNARRKT